MAIDNEDFPRVRTDLIQGEGTLVLPSEPAPDAHGAVASRGDEQRAVAAPGDRCDTREGRLPRDEVTAAMAEVTGAWQPCGVTDAWQPCGVTDAR